MKTTKNKIGSHSPNIQKKKLKHNSQKISLNNTRTLFFIFSFYTFLSLFLYIFSFTFFFEFHRKKSNKFFGIVITIFSFFVKFVFTLHKVVFFFFFLNRNLPNIPVNEGWVFLCLLICQKFPPLGVLSIYKNFFFFFCFEQLKMIINYRGVGCEIVLRWIFFTWLNCCCFVEGITNALCLMSSRGMCVDDRNRDRHPFTVGRACDFSQFYATAALNRSELLVRRRFTVP